MYSIVLGLVSDVVLIKLREYEKNRRMDHEKRDKIFRGIGAIFTEIRPAMSEKRKRKLMRLAQAQDDANSLKESAIDQHFTHLFDPIPVLMKVTELNLIH